ncbi:MAG: T9SS type A sorting domain-containing protein [Calditrichaeota bacterium]|nr:T9SS type A sorting domain-containing protein [Calditrichota bacterium]
MIVAVISLTLGLAGSLFGHARGAPDGYAGDPPLARTCRDCHNTFAANDPNGFIRLDGFPGFYRPGQRYDLQLTLFDPRNARWGFEITALTRDQRPAGDFLVLDTLNTLRSRAREGSPVYIKQSLAGNFSGTHNSVVWRFAWIAPEAGTGPAVFYYSGASCNGDGGVRNDYCYSRGATSQESLGIFDEPAQQPLVFDGLLLSPNPFNGPATLRFSATAPGQFNWSLIDLQGRSLRSGSITAVAAGVRLVSIDASELPDGLYMIRLTGITGSSMVRAVLLR